MHNFTLEQEVKFKLTLDILNDQVVSPNESPYLLDWADFSLKRNEYKDEDKKITLVDRNTGQQLQIGAKIRATAQTDLEITFFCFNCFVNNTD